ncbi:MAG: hypothetical protein RRC07_12695 [Anaerolineae bacterium]|nr:hypothetical protein [Anaerolineae bacterium]
MGRGAGRTIAVLFLLGGLGLLLFVAGLQTGQRRAVAPEAQTAVATVQPTTPAPATASSMAPTRALEGAGDLPLGYLDRFGVTGHVDDVEIAAAAGLPFGSYATWWLQAEPARPQGAFFWQMIRIREAGPVPAWADIDAALAGAPGSVWLIGNEPDNIYQDNVRPERYAEIYHDLYAYIKERDPAALVAIGGVSQPTPLRRAYLDIVLDSYQERYGAPMPVDVWNVHAFILREERDSWGVDIPPGMDDTLAIPYEIEDHLDMGLFRQLLIEFRAWMAARGYGERPLLVSEYGFLMPYEYGFSEAEVAAFMAASFDFFRTARNETGFAADDNRLVQWWLWFIVGSAEDEEWRSTFLLDYEQERLTALGEAYAAYVRDHEPN